MAVNAGRPAPIRFPTGSHPGKRRDESAGRIINGVVEALPEGAEAPFVIRRAPGVRVFGNSGEEGYRGALIVGTTLIAAFAGKLVKFDSAGDVTALSDLTGTDPVPMARNNKLPTPDIVAVANSDAYTIDTTSGAALLNDADLPSPTDVCFGDGYFFFGIADGRVFASGLNATTVGALDYTRTDTRSDALKRVIWYRGRLIAFGADSGEIFFNAALPTGFPFKREAVITGPGLGGKWAITGHEDGWEKGLFWIGSDNAVHTLTGYSAVRVSTPDIDRAIEAIPDKDTIRARCYVNGGHAFVEFSWANGCWVFDVTTQKWAEGESYLSETRRAVGPSVHAFGKWLCGDRADGYLVESSFDEFEERGEPLAVRVLSAKTPVAYGQKCRAEFSFHRGVGAIGGRDPIERDPAVQISWSDDGGYSFSNPIIRKLGRIGRHGLKIELSGAVCGACRGYQGRIWQVVMSDPREFGLLSGTQFNI